MSLKVERLSSAGLQMSPPSGWFFSATKRQYFLTIICRGNAHLHGFVTAADVGLVDEDVRNALLPSHLKQHLLVVGSILYTKALA